MILKLQFAGLINKVEIKQAGSKPLAEISICKKNYAKEGEEPTFTWIRVALWEPKEFQLSKLVKGAFIAGIGDFSMRSFEHNGVKKQSAEVRCGSFDVEIASTEAEAVAKKIATVHPTSGGGASGDIDSPPF